MIKKFLQPIAPLLSIIALVLFCSCEKNTELYVVSFDSTGGNNIVSQTVPKEGKALEPSTIPTKTGNAFVGWFSYDNVLYKWDFLDQGITKDVVLCAKWASNADYEIDDKKTVLLMERDDYAIFTKTVVLFQNENYLIKTPLINFLDGVNDYLVRKAPRVKSELDPLVTQILSDGEKNNLLHAFSYIGKQDLDFILAFFLENGQCYVYDTTNNHTIEQVLIEKWRAVGELSPYGGRTFYFQNKVQFLKITDWSFV
jgi:uncharacterized repeat protein (TIGR02543 family)